MLLTCHLLASRLILCIPSMSFLVSTFFPYTYCLYNFFQSQTWSYISLDSQPLFIVCEVLLSCFEMCLGCENYSCYISHPSFFLEVFVFVPFHLASLAFFIGFLSINRHLNEASFSFKLLLIILCFYVVYALSYASCMSVAGLLFFFLGKDLFYLIKPLLLDD
ncbi:hypothetical protein Peur_013903 [Populus x canadensis]